MGRSLPNRIRLASPSDCTGCGACISICPKGCIQMKEDKEGFLQPRIDSKECIQCHRCENSCPILHVEKQKTEEETIVSVGINKEDGIRARSSSGGVFHALAKWIISQGGVVFGARFNDDWEVVHGYAETLECIIPFMGSKYVQSRIGDTYCQAKAFLEKDRWVLFTGTPCQLGGLRAFLGKDYEKLIQVDLICHGVPSPRVWRDYLKEDFPNAEAFRRVAFRTKDKGWHGEYGMVIEEIRNGGIVTHRYSNNNPFLYGFLFNLFLRPSCYHCAYKTITRNSDITIADAWGVEHYAPEMDDNNGTSLLLVHSLKGREIFDILQPYITMRFVPLQVSLKSNRRATSSVPLTKARKHFFILNRVFGVKSSIMITRKLGVSLGSFFRKRFF